MPLDMTYEDVMKLNASFYVSLLLLLCDAK